MGQTFLIHHGPEPGQPAAVQARRLDHSLGHRWTALDNPPLSKLAPPVEREERASALAAAGQPDNLVRGSGQPDKTLEGCPLSTRAVQAAEVTG